MNEIRIPLKFIGDCVMIVTADEGIIKNTSESGKDEGDLARAYIECDDIYVEEWGKTVRDCCSDPKMLFYKTMDGCKRVRVPLWFGELSELAVPVEES